MKLGLLLSGSYNEVNIKICIRLDCPDIIPIPIFTNHFTI